MEAEEMKAVLATGILWDVALDQVDLGKNARYIIERVVTRGNLSSWRAVLAYYGYERVKREVLEIRYLSSKDLQYLSVFFGLDKSKFRCSG